MKVYYAHCVAIYGSKQEERDVKLLESFGFEVNNPNTPEHQKGYMKIKDADGDAMTEYFKSRVEENDILAFRANPDGNIPSGVHKEIRWAMEDGMDIIELPCGLLRRGLSYELTKEYLMDIGER
jgi:hypothetical protein